ncbi:hypothetical protein [Microbacterium sp. HJ5]
MAPVEDGAGTRGVEEVSAGRWVGMEAVSSKVTFVSAAMREGVDAEERLRRTAGEGIVEATSNRFENP